MCRFLLMACAFASSAYLLVLFTHNEGNDVYVDMTHDFDATTTVYWPSPQGEKFVLNDAGSVYSDDPDKYYTAYKFSAAEHGGTHLDAPKHFTKGKQAANEIPLEKLIGFPYIVDASEEASRDCDFKISSVFLSAYTASHGKIPANSIVLVYTGWSKRWPDLNSYLGTNMTDASLLHFPGLDQSGAEWILSNAQIKSIGIDTASMDYGQSTTFSAHRLLSAYDIPFFENVHNIDKILGIDGVTIYALPMKIKNGSGGPLRIIAAYNSRGRVAVYVMLLVSVALGFLAFGVGW